MNIALFTPGSDRIVVGLRGPAGGPGLDALQKAVGGYIEQVPYFDSFELDGKVYPAVAFCNEEGKLDGLPTNDLANEAWAATLRRQEAAMFDSLCGPVVVLFAEDAAELEGL